VRRQSGSVAVELSGEWRAHASEPDLAKTFVDIDAADETWQNVRVPHHWRAEPAFASSDGPVLYRRRFSWRPTDDATGDRQFLELDGVFYYGDVWFDGEYLGATEGYFVPHAFDVTDALRARDEHVLAIEVACPPQHDRGAQRTITGGYWHSPLLDPELNPGGIWQPLRIATSGPARISHARVVCTEAAVERGRLACHLDVDAGADPREARLHGLVRGPNGVVLLDAWRAVTLAAGTNELNWTLTVDDPPRWWPHHLGPQPLCTVELCLEIDGQLSGSRTFRTAFRDIRRQHNGFTVNGERVFLKGASYGPARALLGDIDDALVRSDVRRAIDANLDLLRVHTHIAPDALYDAADEAGLLLWQDFPMLGGFARGVRRQAVRQARAMVELLGHHPCIAVWCAHDAPLGDDTPARQVANATLPTWGKEVLDRSIARAIGRHDPTRPVVRTSGAGDDSHLWFGWRHGTIAGLAPAIRTIPRLGRFVSAFGAQSVPNTAEWIDAAPWPALDWEHLEAHHSMERDAFDTYVPPGDAKSFDEWRDATQAYQAALLQLQIEDVRRCKGAPSAGFTVFAFADPSPAIGFGVLDHERVAKRAFETLRDACRAVLPMVDPRTGNVHAVNDERVEIAGADIEVSVDGRVRRWRGDLAPDSVEFIGRVDLEDAVDVEAVLTHQHVGRVANRYPLLVLEAGRRGRT
jgi:beta-mannosidase